MRNVVFVSMKSSEGGMRCVLASHDVIVRWQGQGQQLADLHLDGGLLGLQSSPDIDFVWI